MTLDELLGFDPNNPLDAQADTLVNSHADLIEDLRQIRRDSGLSEEQVAERMAWPVEEYVRSVEGYQGNEMRLSTLRRYCLALGVNIEFKIVPFEEEA